MANLSVLYVVRNEEDCIGRSIKSVYPIANEIVVVDTGSMDRTMTICKQYPKVRICSHAWIDDFSATKNYGIGQCEGNWILSLDADERLDENGSHIVRSAVDNNGSNAVAYNFDIADHEITWDSPSNNRPFFPSPQVRLFRRDGRICFEGKVQESLAASASRSGTINALGAVIHHFLWRGKDEEYARGRLAYYKKLGGIFMDAPNLTKPKPTIEMAHADAPKQARPEPTIEMAHANAPKQAKSEPTIEMAHANAPKQEAKPPKTTIVIIAHNRLDVTSQCIAAVKKTVNGVEFVFVDNGSTDGTAEWVAANLPQAQLLRNPKNMGVPYARNQGIRLTRTEYVVLMDNDVIVQDGWLSDLSRPVVEHGFDMAGLEGWQLDNKFQACKKCVDSRERFDYVSGACCIFRRKVFEEVGLYDEGFSPAYYEDVDLVVRAKKMGMKAAWIQTKKIVHKEHSTLLHGQKDFKYAEVMARSQERFARKMRGQIKVTEEKLLPLGREIVQLEVAPPDADEPGVAPDESPKKGLRILYLGMQYDYGIRGHGASYEHCNFYPALKEWKRTAAFEHFDFVEIVQSHGISKMSDMLYERVQAFCPDAIFAVFYDEQHDPQKQMFDRIRATTRTKTISWFCDSHYRYRNHDHRWADHVDWCVTTSQDAVEWYKIDGLAGKVIKSQWAASPLYKKSGLPTNIDASFIGQPHGNRREIIERIRRSGINIQTWGTGWSNRLTFDQMIEIYSRSRINLNMSSSANLQHKQIKGRVFEVPACGGLLLTDLAENLGDYYKIGEEIAVFPYNTNELIERMKYYLSHEEERKKIAEAGYARTMAEHTFAHRFEHIFGTAGLLHEEI